MPFFKYCGPLESASLLFLELKLLRNLSDEAAYSYRKIEVLHDLSLVTSIDPI